MLAGYSKLMEHLWNRSFMPSAGFLGVRSGTTFYTCQGYDGGPTLILYDTIVLEPLGEKIYGKNGSLRNSWKRLNCGRQTTRQTDMVIWFMYAWRGCGKLGC